MESAKPTPEKPESSPAGEPAAEREDVVVSANRCPYCHDAVVVEAGGWVSCLACQGRHHQACWDELGRCGSCASELRMVPDRTRGPSAPQGRKLRLFVAALALLLILLLSLQLPAQRRVSPTRPPGALEVGYEGDLPAGIARFYDLVALDGEAAGAYLRSGLEAALVDVSSGGGAEGQAAARALRGMGLALRLVTEGGLEPWDADPELDRSWRDAALDELEGGAQALPPGELGALVGAVREGLRAQARIPEVARGLRRLLHAPGSPERGGFEARERLISDAGAVAPALGLQVEALVEVVEGIDRWRFPDDRDPQLALRDLEALRGGLLEALAPATLGELRAVLLSAAITGVDASGARTTAFYTAHLEAWRLRHGESVFLRSRTRLHTGAWGEQGLDAGQGASVICFSPAQAARVEVHLGGGQPFGIDPDGGFRLTTPGHTLGRPLPEQGALVFELRGRTLALTVVDGPGYELAGFPPPEDLVQWIEAERARRQGRVTRVGIDLGLLGVDEPGALRLSHAGDDPPQAVWILEGP